MYAELLGSFTWLYSLLTSSFSSSIYFQQNYVRFVNMFPKFKQSMAAQDEIVLTDYYFWNGL